MGTEHLFLTLGETPTRDFWSSWVYSVLLDDWQAAIPLAGLSTKARTLSSRLEDSTVSTSWRRKEERKQRRKKRLKLKKAGGE